MEPASVTVRARIRLEFSSAAHAAAVARALGVDNAGLPVHQRVRGRAVELAVPAAPARSLRATVEDWLRCASTAEASAAAARAGAHARA